MQKKTGRPCTVCHHGHRDKLERLIVLKRATRTELAPNYGLSFDALTRHMENHVSEKRRREIVVEARREATAAVDAQINEEQVEVSSGLKRIVREIETILNRVRGEDDHLALTALRDMRATLIDLAKVYGQLQERTTITVSINEAPEWQRLRVILGDVFRDHPEAGRAFLERAKRERLSIADQRV